MTRTVFILDIDGVLIDPQGYRKATQVTLDWFTQRMGIDTPELTEEILSYFEAQKISSEFDIVPLCLAEYFDQFLANYPNIQLSGDIFEACDQVRSAEITFPEINFYSMANRVGAIFHPGGFISEIALDANRSGSITPPFPYLQSHPLLESILNHTRDIRISPITRLFQQAVLGSEVYKETYGLPSDIEIHSLLKECDRPLLSRENAQLIKDRWNKGTLDLVAYTGRPSSLLTEGCEPLLPYSPEANLALDVVGLTDIPCIGLGQTYRLAELTGENADVLGKPSLTSALGAIATAISRNGMEALSAAAKWVKTGESDYFKCLPSLEVHLFEDTAGSIQCVNHAAKMLNDLGIQTKFQAWGIARTPAKIKSLKANGSKIRDNINEGIHAALGV